MSTMWRRAMHYLGLGPDDEYEDDLGYLDDEPGPADRRYGEEPAAAVRRTSRPAARPSVPPPPPPSTGTVSRLEPPAGAAATSMAGAAESGAAAAPPPPPPAESTAVRPLPGPPRSGGSSAVRTIAAVARVAEVAPVGFNDAQEVGDRFKAGSAVAMDLGGVDRELARRLIDFCSGLCYALGGKMERLGGQSYLIIPSGVEVSAEDRRRLAGAGA